MGPLGIWEIVVIGVVALVVLGPKRLPQAARKAGVWIARLKDETAAVKAELRDAIEPGDLEVFTTIRDDLKEAASLQGVLAPPRFTSAVVKDRTVAALPDPEPARQSSDAGEADEPDVAIADASSIIDSATVTRRLPDVAGDDRE